MRLFILILFCIALAAVIWGEIRTSGRSQTDILSDFDAWIDQHSSVLSLLMDAMFRLGCFVVLLVCVILFAHVSFGLAKKMYVALRRLVSPDGQDVLMRPPSDVAATGEATPDSGAKSEGTDDISWGCGCALPLLPIIAYFAWIGMTMTE